MFIMVYYIHTYPQRTHFSKFVKFGVILPICIHNSLSLLFSVQCTVQNRTRKFFCMNYIDNACMHKFLQNSTRFLRFLQDPTCALFSKCMGFKVIKYDIPLYHEGHKVHEGHEDICISLYFSIFFLNSLHLSAFLMQFSAFL